MNKDFTRPTETELAELIKSIDSFQFDSAHGFDESGFGCSEDLGADELNAIIRSSASMFEACGLCYKYGFMEGMKYKG